MKASMLVVLVVASVLTLPSSQAFSKRTLLNTYGGGVTREYLHSYTLYCYKMTADDVTTVDQAKEKIKNFAGGNNKQEITRVYEEDNFTILLEQSAFTAANVCLGSPNYHPNSAITSKNTKLYEFDHKEAVIYLMTLTAGKTLDLKKSFTAFKNQLAGESLTDQVNFNRLVLATDVAGTRYLVLYKKGYF